MTEYLQRTYCTTIVLYKSGVYNVPHCLVQVLEVHKQEPALPREQHCLSCTSTSITLRSGRSESNESGVGTVSLSGVGTIKLVLYPNHFSLGRLYGSVWCKFGFGICLFYFMMFPLKGVCISGTMLSFAPSGIY